MKSAGRSLISAAILLAAGCATPEIIDPNKKSYFVDVEYTIGADGRTKDAKVIKTDAPKQLQEEALKEVSRYRADPASQSSRARRTIEFAVE